MMLSSRLIVSFLSRHNMFVEYNYVPVVENGSFWKITYRQQLGLTYS